MRLHSLARILFPVAALLTLTPWMGSGTALFMGLILALMLENPYAALGKKLTPKLLSISVIGLGAGMNLSVIGKASASGVGYTVIGIFIASGLGTLLGRLFGTEKDTSLLITVGTAICGGSAIAAISPVIRAKHHEISVALGTVFILNAVALMIFPWVGHQFDLNQTQFGLWCALAIHDTSSVVGAALQYGPKALEVGTTVKLARALWIIPVALIIGFFRARGSSEKKEEGKAKRPWFILGFLTAAALVTWFPELKPAGYFVESIAKHLMVLTLFLIGSGLSRKTIQSVGMRPFLQGIVLWSAMAGLSFAAVYFNVIHAS